MYLFLFFNISTCVTDVKPSIIGKKKPMAAKKGVSHTESYFHQTHKPCVFLGAAIHDGHFAHMEHERRHNAVKIRAHKLHQSGTPHQGNSFRFYISKSVYGSWGKLLHI